MSKLKKVFLAIGILFVVIIIGIVVLFVNMGKNLDNYGNFDFSRMDLSTVEDGVYTGSEDAGIVKASVEVTVKDHTITLVTILSHDCGTGKPAEVIVTDIVENNSLQVDTISGATYSSNVIKKAVYNAVTK